MTTTKTKTRKKQDVEEKQATTAGPSKTSVKLTRGELAHIRDLFGVLLPPAATKTLSQVLAERAGRPILEACLWRKLARACKALDVPLGDDAPDFAVSIGSVPEITVFQVESDDEASQDADLDSTVAAAEALIERGKAAATKERA